METSAISKIAKAIGIKSYSIKKYSDLNKKVLKSINNDELIIYEIFVKKDEKLIPKCSAFKLKDGRMMSAPIEDMTPLLKIKELKQLTNNSLDKISYSMRQE